MSDLQRRAVLMVEREVLCCMSSLVATLANGFPDDLSGMRTRDYPGWSLREQAMELAAPVLDYESAAREAGWRKVAEDAGSEQWQLGDGEDAELAAGAEDACYGSDIEPHECEVYEHWAVSQWLAEKLAAKGERVDTDFAGLNIWGRTTTGQAISSDDVIAAIVTETGYASAATGHTLDPAKETQPMDLAQLAERIRSFRDDAALADPHGKDHQTADIYLREALDLAATPTQDADRERRLRAWAAGAGILANADLPST